MRNICAVVVLLLCFAAMGFAKPQYADHRPFESKVLLSQAQGACSWCFPPSCQLYNNPGCIQDFLAYQECLYYCHYPQYPDGWDRKEKEREVAPIIAYWRKRPEIIPVL